MHRTIILVPTDFSNHAKKALDFAIHLGEKFNSELILFHSYIHNDTLFINPEEKEEENNKRYNAAKKNLDEALSYIHHKSQSVSARYIIEIGTPISLINTVIVSNNVDYVVMGTQGASGLKEILIGSYTEEVVKHAVCPVFAIPMQAPINGIHTILCATDLHTSEIAAAKRVLAFAEILDANVTFLHVSEDSPEEEERNFENLIRRSFYNRIQFKSLQSVKVIESIENYTKEYPVDLLVTLGRERGLYKRIFGKSVPQKLSLHVKVPLLTFPVSDFSLVN